MWLVFWIEDFIYQHTKDPAALLVTGIELLIGIGIIVFIVVMVKKGKKKK